MPSTTEPVGLARAMTEIFLDKNISVRNENKHPKATGINYQERSAAGFLK
jgi:hypothetical protein